MVTIFGKSWDLHVRDDLRIPLKENLELIHDTIRYLKRHVDEVVYDAEHFFDGYRANPEFALECMRVAADAGADVLCLCDTNGGRMPWEISAAIDAVRAQVPTPIGIHCHNDSELAVANSLIAVEHGAVQVQGTINGIGERCGNVNLCSVIANLQLKMGRPVVTAANLRRLRELSRFVDELANVEPNKRQAYVGQSAFAHKGGVHVAAVQRNPQTYEHIDPAVVGNQQRVLVSDLSGRANILYKARQFGVDVEQLDGHVKHLVQEVKQLEHQGFQFEGAEASLELRMHRVQHGDAPLLRADPVPRRRREGLHADGVRRERARRGEDRRAHRARPGIGLGGRDGEGSDGRDRAHRSRGQRPGERARHRPAPRPAPVLPGDRGGAPARLQGPRPRAASRAAPRRCAC